MVMKKGVKPKVKPKKKKRKKQTVKPTIRQKRAVKLLVANGCKSEKEALRKAGYSEAVANNPSKVTKSKAWPALMDEYFPEDFVAEKHRELFEAEDVVFIPRGKKIIERRRPDNTARKGAVDMAHKLRGNFAPEKIEVSRRKFQDMSDKELMESIAEAKKVLLKK